MSRASKATRVEIGKINANVDNAISGVRVTKAYVNDIYEKERFNKSLSCISRSKGQQKLRFEHKSI